MQRPRSGTYAWTLLLPLALVALLAWLGQQRSGPGVVAASKSIRPDLRLFAAPHDEASVRAAFEADPLAAARLDRGRVLFIQAVPLTTGEAGRWTARGCAAAGCAHLLYYDFSAAGTLEGVVDLSTNRVLDIWEDGGGRPLASAHVLPRAAEIAAQDDRVRAVLGEFDPAEIMMVPMNTWLLDSPCLVDWCVDLTFADPAGSGQIFHVTVNMQREEVARTFYTRGRPARPFRDLAPRAAAFTDGCQEDSGWSVCWQMTAHDGLEFTNASFEGKPIFRSAKVGQVEVWYPSWPGGYRDEIGHSGSVPPYFDTIVDEIDGGFAVRQIFTEVLRWPNCICCYRYEQSMAFFADGAFEARTISFGPGCDDLSIYQPFWRIDLDLNGPEDDQAWVWQESRWVEAVEELEFVFQPGLDSAPDGVKLVTFDEGVSYSWRYLSEDPLGEDEARFFLLQFREQEGDNPIITGPANSFQPPRQWLGRERASRDNLVLWVVPVLKTRKGEPWWCMPEPGPEGSPCAAVLRAEPVVGGRPSTQTTPAPTRTPRPTAIPGAKPAVPLVVTIEGEDAATLLLNAGCTACHVIGDLGSHGKVGPDLSQIGRTAGGGAGGLAAREAIRRSILFPNETLAEACPNGPCLPNIMPPNYGERLSAVQLELIVEFLMAQTGGGEVAFETGSEPAARSAAPLLPTVAVAPGDAVEAPGERLEAVARQVFTNGAGSILVFLVLAIVVIALLALMTHRKN